MAADKEVLRELSDMKRTSNAEERKYVDAALKHLSSNSKRDRLEKSTTVGVTCASSASQLLENQVFDVVILDESSQITEPLSLVPIVKSSCHHCLLVGDPKQLPPVVQTSAALTYTLFERLAISHEPTRLVKQYRCHPKIASVASKLFYNNTLQSGVDNVSPIFGSDPMIFVDVFRGRSGANGSLSNEMEAREICAWIKFAIRSEKVNAEELGVITPYISQARLIRRFLGDEDLCASIVVSTVDSFQGAEREMILISTVISSEASKASLKFVSDSKRLCVAMTRAKRQLVVIGHRDTLMRDRRYREIIRSSKCWSGDGAGVRARVELSSEVVLEPKEVETSVKEETVENKLLEELSSNIYAKGEGASLETAEPEMVPSSIISSQKEEKEVEEKEEEVDDEDLLMLLDEDDEFDF